jgi:hypothetical protein
MRVDGIEPFVNFTDAVGILGVLGFLQQSRTLFRRREHGLERRRRPARRFLGEIADARAGRRLDGSAVGLIEPGDDFQQRGFSRPVAAHQTDTRFRGQRRRGVIEDEMTAEAEGDAVKRNHGVAPYSEDIGLSEYR